MKKRKLIAGILFLLSWQIQAQIFYVSNTNPTGNGSLYQAIVDANNASISAEIRFTLTGSPPYTITPTTSFPDLTKAIKIDATTQAGWYLGAIIINGSNIPNSRAFEIDANNCEFYGMYIKGFNSSGSAFRWAATTGNNCTIGASGKGNVISGNTSGIFISGANASGTRIQYNYIGLAADGITPEANSVGISTSGTGSVGNLTINNNVVSGNTGEGISLAVQSCTVSSNKIGTRADGTGSVPNDEGIRVAAANCTITGNTVANSTTANISLASGSPDNTQITNNIIYGSQKGIYCAAGIASDFNNNQIYCNTVAGIDLDGGNANYPAPVITSNGTTTVRGTANIGDFIGLFRSDDTGCTGAPAQGKTLIGYTNTDINGNWQFTLGSLSEGEVLTATAGSNNAGTSEFSAAYIASCIGSNITVTNTNDTGSGSLREAINCANTMTGPNTITFSLTGSPPYYINTYSALPTITDGDLTIDGGNAQNVILDGQNNTFYGLTSMAPRTTIKNLQLKRFDHGIFIESTSNNIVQNCIVISNTNGTNTGKGIYCNRGGNHTIEGNYVGIDNTFTAHPNNFGIYAYLTDGVTIQGNYVGANTADGIETSGPGSIQVLNNFVGTDPTGTIDVGNGASGIYTIATGTNITGNMVAFNNYGIYVNVATGVLISQNSVFCNNTLGITLQSNGNNFYPAPVITAALPSGEVSGTGANGDVIEVFLNNDTGCTNAPCQGKTYLGETTVSGGQWSLTGLTLNAGDKVTATARYTDGNNTSEFSACVAVQCSSNAGTFNMPASPLEACKSDAVIAPHNNDATLDGNDVLEFIIHDDNVSPPGNIFYRSSTTDMYYDASMSVGTTYYISAIVGNNNGSGQVDETDPCLSIVGNVPVIFYEPFTASNVTLTCNGNSYTVVIEIAGGKASAYSVTGGAGNLSGNIFTSDPIPSGTAYDFLVSDGICADLPVAGTKDCGCTTNSGTMSNALVEVCDATAATATHQADQTLDSDDVLEFILHDNAANSLGSIFARSASPSFSIQAGMSVGTTYYISAIAGNNDGTGKVDTNDACLSVAAGTPVIFYAPISISNVQETCDVNNNFVVTFTISGGNGNYITTGGPGGNVNGNLFTSNPFVSGSVYDFQVWDAVCTTRVQVTGTKDCTCVTNAGTVNTTAEELCQSETVIASHNNNNLLDGDDVLEFIMHTNAGNTLGTIIARQATSSFGYQAGMSFGTTYYISAVAGNNDGTGKVNTSDPCLSVSLGKPVIFFDSPSISNLSESCNGNNYVVSFDISGGKASAYSVTGGAGNLTGNTFTSNPIPSGTAYNFQVTDGICNPVPVTGTKNCTCTPPTTPSLSAVDATLCKGGTLTINVTPTYTGNSISYQWTTPLGSTTTTVPTLNITNVTSSNAGNYSLIVQIDGCSSLASSDLAITAENPSDLADAGTDKDVCGTTTTATLQATTPASATGVWTSQTAGVSIASPTSSSTQVSNLQEGQNIFVWTLSTATCPDYSRDNVIVNYSAGSLVANLDVAQMLASESEVQISVLGNDEGTDISSVVSITNNPSQGTALVQGQKIIYTKTNPNFSGSVEFSYKVCSSVCPTVCDEATVRVIIAETRDPKDPDVIIPGGLTINGDGKNEVFEIEGLDQYPENELLITNRWGDIVFRAKPYQNNWDGTFQGKPLPQGTYYFVLRTDINNKRTMKGAIYLIK